MLSAAHELFAASPQPPIILVVEDEEMARRALCVLLDASGYSALAVQSAEEALETIADGMRPRVVLVDLELPGMCGLELIRRLEKSMPSAKTILITAAPEEKVAVFRRRHPDQYLRKPLNFKALLNLIGQDKLPV